MQDYRIDTFLAVCRFMNYTRAAECLHITQPAVSQHIRYLEKHYGQRLFYYRGKKLIMTKAGNLLYKAATTIKNDEIMLRGLMQEGEREKVLFGATRTIGDYVLPEKLAAYILRHPESDIQMQVNNTERLLKQIDDGALEFAFIEGYFQRSDYDYSVFSSERFIAVRGALYDFTKQPEVLSDLFDERIILREPGSGSREIFERHMEERNHSINDFKQMIEIGSIYAIKKLVNDGCGITFLYEAAALPEIKSGELKRIYLEDFEPFHDFSVVWRKNSMYKARYEEIFSEILNTTLA